MIKLIITLNLIALIIFIISIAYAVKVKNKSKINVIGIIIGVVFIFFSIILGAFYSQQKSDYKGNTKGIIVDVHIAERIATNSEIEYTYYPILEFYVDGEKYEEIYSYGSKKKYIIGDEVNLRYLEENPQDFLLEGENLFAYGSIFISICGSIFMLLSIFMPKYMISNNEK